MEWVQTQIGYHSNVQKTIIFYNRDPGLLKVSPPFLSLLLVCASRLSAVLKSKNWPFTAPQRRANPAVYVAGNALFYNDFWCPPVLVCFVEAKRIPFLPPPESLDRGGQLQKSKKGDSLKTYCKSKDRWKGLSGTSSKTNRKTMNFELGEKRCEN